MVIHEAVSIDELEWFDVILQISNPGGVADAWLNEIDSKISSKKLDFVRETFLRAGLRVYRVTFGKKIAAKDIYTTAGYSKSTFQRMFHSFPSYQLKLYQFLGQAAVDVYSDYLFRRERTPEEFCRFTRDCIYSSHLAVPSSTVSEIYRINSPISPHNFHPFVSHLAEIMYGYIRQHQHLGYRPFSQQGLTEVIRTLDYDILFSKVNETATFPNTEQAYRLERMLLAYVT